MLQKRLPLAVASLAILILFTGDVVKAADEKSAGNSCKSLPNFSALKALLDAATATETSGLNNQMWATIVDRDGVVCAVAFTGVNRGAQWPGSRVISAQKANTANAFSLDSSSSNSGSGQPNGLALSTANLYSAVQPGGSLFGLQESNPVDTQVAYGGPSSNYGAPQDSMVGHKVGGINVFGGGLALYGVGKKIVGGVGVSGDTSWAWTTCPGWAACQEIRRGPIISSSTLLRTRTAVQVSVLAGLVIPPVPTRPVRPLCRRYNRD